MKYEKDIAAHVISNIALIESTKSVIEDVESTIFRQFNAVAKKHIEKSGLLLGNDNKFELYHSNEYHSCYFSTVGWEESYVNQVAWYAFCYGPEEAGENLSPLSHLLGESSKNAYLRLQFRMEKDELGIGLRKFKSFLNDAFFKAEALGELGFQLSECSEHIELKFNLDREKVAEVYPNLEESFCPLIKVLDTVFEAHPHFEKMVEEVKLLAKAEVSDVQEA